AQAWLPILRRPRRPCRAEPRRSWRPPARWSAALDQGKTSALPNARAIQTYVRQWDPPTTSWWPSPSGVAEPEWHPERRLAVLRPPTARSPRTARFSHPRPPRPGTMARRPRTVGRLPQPPLPTAHSCRLPIPDRWLADSTCRRPALLPPIFLAL